MIGIELVNDQETKERAPLLRDQLSKCASSAGCWCWAQGRIRSACARRWLSPRIRPTSPADTIESLSEKPFSIVAALAHVRPGSGGFRARSPEQKSEGLESKGRQVFLVRETHRSGAGRRWS